MSTKVNKFPVSMYFYEDAGFLFSVLSDIIEAKYGDPEDIMEHIPSMDQLEREHRRYALGQAFGHEAGMEEAKAKKKTTKKKKGSAK